MCSTESAEADKVHCTQGKFRDDGARGRLMITEYCFVGLGNSLATMDVVVRNFLDVNT